MSAGSLRISVPVRIPVPPRSLTDDERRTLLAVSDSLIGAGGGALPSGTPGFEDWLDRALAARAEQFDQVIGLLARLRDVPATDMWGALRTAADADVAGFHVLSSVVAGAYLMVPEVRERIGYPGQGGAAPRLEEAAEQLEDGILDAVIERGPIFVSAAGE